MGAKKRARSTAVLVVAALGTLLRATAANAQGPAHLVKDINPDTSSSPLAFADVGGSLLFFQGLDLWKSDGSAAGTQLVVGGVGFGFFETTANGLLFFSSGLGSYGGSLWRSDGTAAGTFQLLSYEGPHNSGPKNLVNLNGTLFFSAFTGGEGSGYGIFKSDGTVAGTVPVIAIGETYPQAAVANGKLFFTGEDTTFRSGLWVTDGTADGTHLVKEDLVFETYAEAFTVVNTRLFFRDNSNQALWVSDGTPAGTVLVKALDGFVGQFTAAGPRLFFVRNDSELWTSDGTAAGTTAVKQFPLKAGASLSGLTSVNERLFFSADDGIHGAELWKSDGTALGTVLVKDINPGSAGSGPSSLTNVDGMLFFSAADGNSGAELWKSDGAIAGTVRVQDIRPGAGSSDPMFFTVSGSHLFFTADDGAYGYALWALPIAATMTVNSTADNTTAGDGKCTLREAIANVNAASDTTGGDCAAGTGSGDIIVFDLTLPATITLTMNTGLVISREVTINGPGAGVLVIDGNRGSRVIAAGTVRIADLTLQNGSGILVNGAASVMLTNSAVRGNSGDGGGLYIAAGGTATLFNTTVSNNTDGNNGEGIYISAGGTATLTNCTLSGNGPSGGGGEGGGLYVAAGATATLSNCTLSGNYNVGGAALANFGTAMLTNCTLSDNRVNGSDGALASFGTTTLTNTIVANTVNGANCSGATVSMGHNLDSDGTCKFSSPGDLSHMDPNLGQLQDNGGPTFTHALLAGSPAIDAGDDAVTGPPLSLTTDQRGLPRESGRHVDIGADEVQQAGAPLACVGDCSGTSTVVINDLITLVNIALGDAQAAACPHGLPNGAGVDVAVITQAVNNALNGCAVP